MKKIKWMSVSVVIFFILLGFGCYLPITIKVIDAETGEPIEGAVVMVEWTKLKGMIGLSHTESYKVIEVLTNKEGKAKISGVYEPSPDLGSFVVYKKGYVAWSYDYIFPDYKKRIDYKWDSRVIKLERFKNTYSYVDHSSFIDSVARPESATEEKKLFLEAYNTWERGKTIQEMREKRKRDGYR